MVYEAEAEGWSPRGWELPNGTPPSDGMWVPNVPWGLHRSLRVHGGCGYTGWLLLRQEHPTKGWVLGLQGPAPGWRLGCTG